MAEKQAPPSRRGGEQGGKQAPSRRNDVIRCENCGEDYSVTYKRCPFCDERPGRGGFSGKRVANTRGGGYGRGVNPIQIVGLVISLILIVSALFIVLRFFGSSLLGGGKTPAGSSQQSSTSTSQSAGSSSGADSSSGSTSGSGQGSSSQAGSSQGGSSSQSGSSGGSGTGQTVTSITLSKTDVTLRHGEKFQLTATLAPAGVTEPVVWSSSHPDVASVDENGLVVNQNSGSEKTVVTITATCGGVTQECLVRCNPKSGATGGETSTGGGETSTGGGTSTGPVAPNTPGTIVNAENGLRIRSGPGTSYDVVASAPNGASVVILGEENGWYQIKYSGSSTGYVSKEFVSVGG